MKNFARISMLFLITLSLVFSLTSCKCRTCNDTTKTTCNKCDGTRKVICFFCEGDYMLTCEKCDGSGQANCTRCGGSGRINNSYPSLHNYPTSTLCSSCAGRGYLNCDKYKECNYCTAGKRPCNECDENGQIECPDCKPD